MASIIKVGEKHRAQVRRAGHPVQTRTFDDKREAEQWARKIEAEIDAGKKVGVYGKMGVTVADAIDRYVKENKDLGKTGISMMGYLKKGLGSLLLERITSNDIVEYIKNKNFGPMSGFMHFSFLSSVLTMSSVGWEYYVPEILPSAKKRLKILKLIGSSEKRDRRPTDEEISLLLKYEYPTPIPMADIVQFAISSAMRQAEITRIEYNTFNQKDQTIVITDRKHPTEKKGNHQVVPLTSESIEIIKRQKKKDGDDRVFPYKESTIGTYFTLACKKLGIENLHFHDLRHEGASRLFEMGYQIEEVSKFTGHQDWKMLQRYTHLKAKDIRRLSPVRAIEVEKKEEIVKTDSEHKEVQMNPEIRERLKEEMRKELMAEIFAKMAG